MVEYKIYKITNLITNRSYIGATIQDLEVRLKQHAAMKSCRYINASIAKHGIANFKIDLVELCTNEQHMLDREIILIAEHGTLTPDGYNLQPGGQYFNYKKDTSEKKSTRTKRRWKERPESFGSFLEKSAQRSFERREPIVGVNIHDATISRYTSTSEARALGIYSTSSLNGQSIFSKDHVWFYDEGLADLQYIELAKKRIGCDFGEYSKGAHSWKVSDYKARIDAMTESSKPRMKAIVSVHTQSSKVTYYESVHAAMRDKYSPSSIYAALTGEDKTGQKHCWFYQEDGLTNANYQTKAIALNGPFKTDFTKPIIGTNIKTNEILVFRDVYELAEITGIKVKIIRNRMRKNGYCCGWIFKFQENVILNKGDL